MGPKNAVVSRRVVPPAEILAPGIRQRIAIQSVIRIVDRSFIDLRVLKIGSGDRVAIGETER